MAGLAWGMTKRERREASQGAFSLHLPLSRCQGIFIGLSFPRATPMSQEDGTIQRPSPLTSTSPTYLDPSNLPANGFISNSSFYPPPLLHSLPLLRPGTLPHVYYPLLHLMPWRHGDYGDYGIGNASSRLDGFSLLLPSLASLMFRIMQLLPTESDERPARWTTRML